VIIVGMIMFWTTHIFLIFSFLFRHFFRSLVGRLCLFPFPLGLMSLSKANKELEAAGARVGRGGGQGQVQIPGKRIEEGFKTTQGMLSSS
jgi:hypothetical protein